MGVRVTGTGFSVDMSALEAFRAKLARSIERNFGDAGAAGSPPLAGGTNMVPREFGGFTEARSAHGTYGPSQGSMVSLLAEVDALINRMHDVAHGSASRYEHADGASSRAAAGVRGRLPAPR